MAGDETWRRLTPQCAVLSFIYTRVVVAVACKGIPVYPQSRWIITHLALLEVPDLVLDHDDRLSNRVYGLRRGLLL